jgi:integrase
MNASNTTAPALTTIREIFDWYAANDARELDPVSNTERKRVRRLFCEFRGDEGTPFGQRAYTSFRPFHLLAFINANPKLVSRHARRRWVVTINAPMNAAVRLGMIDRNPFVGLRLPMGKTGRDWTDDEYRSLLRNSRPPYRRLLVFIRFSGARPGEARAAKWSHIDHKEGVIVLTKHKTAAVTGEPRKIRLNHVALGLLAWIARNQDPPHECIFLNKHRRPWTTGSLTKYLRDLRKRVGLSHEVKLHSGRHYFATRGLTNGVDLATMAALLGHRRIETTQLYVHLVNKHEHLNGAAERAIGAVPRPVHPFVSQRAEQCPESAPAQQGGPATPAFFEGLLDALVRRAVSGQSAPKAPAPTLYLTDAQQRDYEAYTWAVSNHPELLSRASDTEVFFWLKGQPQFTELPNNSDVFRRNLSRARLVCGTQKVKYKARHPIPVAGSVEKVGAP